MENQHRRFCVSLDIQKSLPALVALRLQPYRSRMHSNLRLIPSMYAMYHKGSSDHVVTVNKTFQPYEVKAAMLKWSLTDH